MGDFRAWLVKFVLHYKNLSDEESIEVIDSIINASSSRQLWYLQQKTFELSHRDFLTLLPPELQEYLISFLDPETLLKCCCVNKYWNTLISSNCQAWHSACNELEMKLPPNYFMFEGNYLKNLYIRMKHLHNDLQNQKAFTNSIHKITNTKITAISYWKQTIAVGSEDKNIYLWNCNNKALSLTIPVSFTIADIKFDEDLLIVSSCSGALSSWHLPSGEHCKVFSQHYGSVFTIDFSKQLNLLVSGSADYCIKLWNLTSAKLINSLRSHRHWVLKVLFVPTRPDLLLTMDRHEILMWTLDSTEFCSLHILCQIPIALSDINFFTPGLHCDGQFIYFIKQNPELTDQTYFCCWDVQNQIMKYEQNLSLKVKALVAVGNKYICLFTPWRDLKIPNFIIMKKTSLNNLTCCHIRQTRATIPGSSMIVAGNSEWLDGLDGQNNQGIVAVSGLEDGTIEILKWES